MKKCNFLHIFSIFSLREKFVLPVVLEVTHGLCWCCLRWPSQDIQYRTVWLGLGQCTAGTGIIEGTSGKGRFVRWKDLIWYCQYHDHTFYCVLNLLSYLDYSNEFDHEANLRNIFWIQLSFILVMWSIPANQIPFQWICLRGISKMCCWDLPHDQIH